MRSPGFDTRRRPAIVRVRSCAYLSWISRTLPGPALAGATANPAMYPSRSRMTARDSLSLELGIFTLSCMAVLALRIRVSMSAMGSVIVMGASLPSPARLGDTGDLPRVHHDAQADATEAELAQYRPRTAAPPASGVGAHLELGRPLLLLDQCLLGHCARRS